MSQTTTAEIPEVPAEEGDIEAVKPPEPPPHTSDWVLLSFFWGYLKPYWGWVALGIASIPISIGATLLIPELIIRMIDQYVVTRNIEGLYSMVALMGGAVLLGYLADAIYSFSLQKSGQLAIAAMRRDLYRHTLRLPRRYFDHQPIGVILTRLTSDMEAMGESMAVGALTIFTDLLKTLALFGFLMYHSWKLTLLLLLILPPIYLCSKFLRQKLRHYYNSSRETLAESTGFLQECLNGVKTIQLYASEAKVIRRYSEKTGRFLHAQSWANFYEAALFSVIEGITSIALGLMIWYGAQQILTEVVTIGTLVGFINVLNRIFVPIREFTQQISVIQRAFSALENIFKLFHEPPEEDAVLPEAQALQEFQELRFENVYFRYHEHGPYILKGVSFALKKGDRLAIVGTTGSGKSTIVRLITKNYTQYQGSITINGVELSKIPRKEVHRLMAMMQQDVYLFNESLGFNISLNRPQVTPAEARQAAEYVYAQTFIENLPGKYDFEILDGGKNLSAGQAQLVAFARAIAGNNGVIILDEATSAVDSVTEHLIQKAIEKIFREKTVIAIAHRLSTIQNSDQILVMQEGQILERGKHEALIAQGGTYAKLVQKLEGSPA